MCKYSSTETGEDWEKARVWLNQEKVTKMSAKVPYHYQIFICHFICDSVLDTYLLLSLQIPSLRDIVSEYELYTYLKDGTELCRMIGLVTTGQVLQGIVYRPNNISTLEEKNISLFLSHVEKELKLSDLFGRENGSQALHKFSNFHIVISGLAKVSEKIQKRDRDIRSFHSSGNATVVREVFK